jgi:hypothetical protein
MPDGVGSTLGSPRFRPSRGIVKVGAVLAGYVVAVLVAWVAVSVYVARSHRSDAEASGGMYAFGDSLLFLAVFGVVSVIPTGTALFFLRPYRRFWPVLSIVTLGLAATGCAAALVYILAAWPSVAGPGLHAWSAFAVLRLLIAPLLIGFYVLAALFTPERPSRVMLATAAVLEGVAFTLSFFRLLGMLP